jgi:hypothetical protein
VSVRENQGCNELIIPRHSVANRGILASLLTLLCCASPCWAAGGDDALQTIRTMSVQCRDDFRSGDDAAANQSCHALERQVDTSLAPVAASLMAQKKAGKKLSRSDFFVLLLYVSTERLATNAMARIYYRVRTLHPEALQYGRQFAVQAVAWSIYDAVNIRDLFALAKREDADGPQSDAAKQTQKMMRANQADDKKNPAQLERLYPGVTAEALSSMHMSRATYNHLMSTL